MQEEKERAPQRHRVHREAQEERALCSPSLCGEAFIAKYPGSCGTCGSSVTAGDHIQYDFSSRMVTGCYLCSPSVRASTDAFEDGLKGWWERDRKIDPMTGAPYGQSWMCSRSDGNEDRFGFPEEYIKDERTAI
jgi:hypothetical protein